MKKSKPMNKLLFSVVVSLFVFILFYFLFYENDKPSGWREQEKKQDAAQQIKGGGETGRDRMEKQEVQRVIKVQLEDRATLVGHVVDEEGNPCSGLSVAVVDSENILSPLELKNKNDDYYLANKKNLDVFSEIKNNASKYQVCRGDKIFPWWIRDKMGEFIRTYASIPEEEVIYHLMDMLQGYSVFEKEYHDRKLSKKVVLTDQNGKFTATNLPVGRKLKITIFGATSAGERIYPYEEEMVFDKPGGHQADFQVDRGSTVLCSFSLQNGRWEELKNHRLQIFTILKHDEQKPVSSRYLPRNLKQEYTIGPMFSPGEFTISVKVVLGAEAKQLWEGNKTLSKLKPGLNAINMTLKLKEILPIMKKTKGIVKIIIVDESGRRLFSGQTDAGIKGYSQDKDKYVMKKELNRFIAMKGMPSKYFSANEEGDLELPITGDGPYMLHVEISAAVHEQKNVSLSPGDLYEFIVPDYKLARKGNVSIRIIPPEGELIKKAKIKFVKKGKVSPYKTFTAGPELTVNYLDEGEYNLVIDIEGKLETAGDKCVSVIANKTQYIEVQAYATTSMTGKFIGNDNIFSDCKLFLSGVTERGQNYRSTLYTMKNNGQFTFKKVPRGDYHLLAVKSNKAMFGPERLLIADLDKKHEVVLEANYNGRNVEFQLKDQQGTAESAKEKKAYIIKNIEISSEDGEELFWEFKRNDLVPLGGYRRGVPLPILQNFSTFLPTGTFKVNYCVSRVIRYTKPGKGKPRNREYVTFSDEEEPYSFRTKKIVVEYSPDPLCIELE